MSIKKSFWEFVRDLGRVGLFDFVYELIDPLPDPRLQNEKKEKKKERKKNRFVEDQMDCLVFKTNSYKPLCSVCRSCCTTACRGVLVEAPSYLGALPPE